MTQLIWRDASILEEPYARQQIQACWVSEILQSAENMVTRSLQNLI